MNIATLAATVPLTSALALAFGGAAPATAGPVTTPAPVVALESALAGIPVPALRSDRAIPDATDVAMTLALTDLVIFAPDGVWATHGTCPVLPEKISLN